MCWTVPGGIANLKPSVRRTNTGIWTAQTLQTTALDQNGNTRQESFDGTPASAEASLQSLSITTSAGGMLLRALADALAK